MRAIMAEVAEHGLSVLLSSHVVSDLEETCDWLVVLNGGRLQVSGDIEDLLAGHLVLTGPAELAGTLTGAAGTRIGPAELGKTLTGRAQVVAASRTARQVRLLVRGEPPLDPRWQARRPGLDELVMGYLRSPESAALPGLAEAGR
jgi:ABC-2 type transport system ATP-binding protein